MSRKVTAADLFCGAGGTSSGLALAAEELGVELSLTAINHWPIAVETHKANHPWAKHLCKSLHEVDPRKEIEGGKLTILVASPECQGHSIARGGVPTTDQKRASGFQIVDWLAALRVEHLIVENVREYRDWGPLGSDGRPLKSRKGETFRAWKQAIESLNYRVEERIVNAADHGDPTTRERLFVQARRGRGPIKWPDASHDQSGMHTGQKWRAAREIIDFSIEGESIFARKRPLSPNTMRRIETGLKKFSGLSFTMPVNHGPELRSRSVNEPLPTLTARANQYVVEPFLVSAGGPNVDARPVSRPANTVLTRDHMAVVQPFILPHRQFDGMQVDSVERPMRTIGAHNGGDNALVQPFLVPQFGERPGQTPRTHSVDVPAPAVTSHGAGALVEGFLVKYHGTEKGARSLSVPLGTLTTKDRYALVWLDGQPYHLDIRFRMLQPSELAGAMGFPAHYKFAGNRGEQIRQVGNAVCVRTARALCRSALEDVVLRRAA